MQAQVADMTTMLSQVLKNQNSKEKELQDMIEKKGGVRAVVDQDDVLLELSTKFEDKDVVDKSSSVVKGKDAQKTLDAGLRIELSTSVKDLLKANENLFLKKFDAQTAQISQAMERSADRVILSLSKGPYQRVEDPDIRALWKEERWRSNVKARLFILSLHDYFTTQRGQDDDDKKQDSQEDLSKLTFIGPGHPEEWTLEYMSGTYLSSLKDAIDDDGSGFVSINEINDFSRQKQVPMPKDMSLPVWIAYWAAGWDLDSNVYEKKIGSLIKQMKEMEDEVLDDNKESVKTYLSSQFDYIEKLTTYDVDEDDDGPDLLEMTKIQRSKNEERIRKNLEDVKVDPAPAAGRRHAQIIKLCKEYVLDPRELELGTSSLDVVTDEVYNRVSNLKAGFTQQRLDLDKTFEFYCNGIYDELYQFWYRDNSDSESESEEVSDSDDEDEGTDAGTEGADNAAKTGSDTSEHHNDEVHSGAGSDDEGKDNEANFEDGEDKENEVTGSEEGDGSQGGTDEREEARAGTPTTVAEEVVPLRTDLLRFPATKAEKEAIEALEVKVAAAKAEKEAKEAEGTDDGENEGSVKEEGPPKTVEERLESLESDMKSLVENMKEVLRRLPPKRR
ncbi:hypothetical protein FRB98_004440 [Tulasnella sp. 332]|nr:hypothetical protein FRB98_004440 [Tulasnella sp. 332]